jgi:signal transduction histidine kinase
MSHELRTPLNAIIGFSEVMREQMFGPIGNRRYASYIDDINASGLHLLGIVNDVLDLSKLEAHSMRLAQETVDPTALARDCVKIVQPQAEAARVRLIIEGADDSLRIGGDALRLKQILLNLLSNAVKFSYPGGEVILTQRPDADGGLVIGVRDNGIGMNPAGIATALQPFGQVENSWTRRHAGTGLGLPLAKWLVELHDGRLTIDSAPGKGTLVKIVLPPARISRIATAADLAPAA